MTQRTVSTEEFANSSVKNDFSSRRAEIKVRKNEMKLRKKDFEVPKIFLIAPWRISVSYRGICDFLGGMVPGASKSVGVHRGS